MTDAAKVLNRVIRNADEFSPGSGSKYALLSRFIAQLQRRWKPIDTSDAKRLMHLVWEAMISQGYFLNQVRVVLKFIGELGDVSVVMRRLDEVTEYLPKGVLNSDHIVDPLAGFAEVAATRRGPLAKAPITDWAPFKKFLNKRRKNGGVQDARAVLNADGSVTTELGGKLEDSISLVRENDVMKEAALSGGGTGEVMDFAHNRTRNGAPKIGPPKERSYNGILLTDYQRAHLWGHGFGDEARAGIMYAPKIVNQFFQNKKFERHLRLLQKHAAAMGGEVKLVARAKSHPIIKPGTKGKLSDVDPDKGELVLESVSYEYIVSVPGQPKLVGKVGLQVGLPPDGKVLKELDESDDELRRLIERLKAEDAAGRL